MTVIAADLHILGIRHHGPGSARMVMAALEKVRPDAVLIEGPPDADDLIALAGHAEMKPPVALLVYNPDQPSDAAYYPFAEFSPEWQAMRWALSAHSHVQFIDLPVAVRRREQEAEPSATTPGPDGSDDPSASPGTRQEPKSGDGGVGEGEGEGEGDDEFHSDPLDALARAAGFEDGEAWWGTLVEERGGDEDPLAIFDAIRDAMTTARESQPAGKSRRSDEPAREAHMRRCIRAAVRKGFERICVVCGAWHAPVLTLAALKTFSAKDDDAALKGVAKRKTTATWVPWTHGRLTAASGYGAGVRSPGWYEHLWHHGGVTATPRWTSLGERWMTRVARLMRDEQLDASPAHVIESVRLADALAALRGRGVPGLEEFNEATLAILTAGNPLPMRLIERKLIVGERLGEVPADAPSLPLQRDLAAQQKSLRMKPSADETILELDQRNEMDLARSRLLHRLCLLDVPWGIRSEGVRRSTGTFRETWRLQWKPEFAVMVIEAGAYGNSVEHAAEQKVVTRTAAAAALPELTSSLEHVMLADLPNAMEALIERIQVVSAVSADLGHLMEALPPLAGVLRYGDVRRTESTLVRPVVHGLSVRICAGLSAACASLDDDAAAAMRVRIDGVDSALAILDDAALLGAWRERLRAVGDADVHGLIAGRCWRMLLDAPGSDENGTGDQAETRLSLALSRGNDPSKASAWLEGFLSGSAAVLVHDQRLLAVVDAWVCSLTRDAFEQTCPIARRTFATFEPAERRMIGEQLRRSSAPGGNPGRGETPGSGQGYDADRGELVLPTLRLILGEEL